ncbi:hypothetical protein OROMI_023504 [Orobanche minor]
MTEEDDQKAQSEVPREDTKLSENLKEDSEVVEENGEINKIDDEGGNNVLWDGNEKENTKETDGACNSPSPASDENKKENVEEIEKDDRSTLPLSSCFFKALHRSKIEAYISSDTLPAERVNGKEDVKIDRDISLLGRLFGNWLRL